MRGLTSLQVTCQKMLGLCPIMNSISLLNLETKTGSSGFKAGQDQRMPAHKKEVQIIPNCDSQEFANVSLRPELTTSGVSPQ